MAYTNATSAFRIGLEPSGTNDLGQAFVGSLRVHTLLSTRAQWPSMHVQSPFLTFIHIYSVQSNKLHFKYRFLNLPDPFGDILWTIPTQSPRGLNL